MKTAEEKAEEYVDMEIPIAYTDETQTVSLTELRQAAKIDYLAGYNEATRWRDPNIEPPEVGMKVLVKTSNGKYSVTEMYTYKDSSGTTHGAEWRGSYNFRMSVIGWRPIE